MQFINDIFCEKVRIKETINTKYYSVVQTATTTIKDMVAFANSDGGYIIWGVDYDTELEVIGISDDVYLKNRIEELTSRLPIGINYSITLFSYNKMNLIGIIVHKSSQTILLDGTKYIMKENKCVVDEPKIFISHSSKDKKYGKALVRLIESIGVSNKNIIFTSDDIHGIPLGQNIFDFLKNEISSNAHMLYLLSDNYFESPACLNEMGASWIIKNDYTFIGTPEFSFSNSKFSGIAIDIRTVGFTMDNKSRLIEFRNMIYEKFNLPNIDDRIWYEKLDEYINEIRNS